MKQVQWATYSVGKPNLRAEVESLLNQKHPWVLRDWKIVGMSVDETNQPVVDIVVCVEREVIEPTAKAVEEPAQTALPKRGRPKKNA